MIIKIECEKSVTYIDMRKANGVYQDKLTLCIDDYDFNKDNIINYNEVEEKINNWIKE